MNVLVTGAAGFVGRMLVTRLLGDADHAGSRITLLDQRFDAPPADSRVSVLEAALGDASALRRATEGADLVFHLASVPGGAAARNFQLGLEVNLQGTVALLERLRESGCKPRVVFASTIGVYGVPLPRVIDEDTLPAPSMSYGAHKLIGEVLMRDYSLREYIDARSLRLPGIVARPPQPSGMLSAFLSDMIRQLWNGQEFTCPVAAEGKSWWMSRRCVVDNLLHAARLSPEQAAAQRVYLLPVLHASMAEVVAAIARVRGPEVLRRVKYEHNAALQEQFANLPPMQCPRALAAGFRSDGTLEALVERALEE